MARPPLGPELVDRLEGSRATKRKLKVILETLSGEKTVPQAMEALGVGEARFHEMRKEALLVTLEALEPKPVGRPPREETAAGQGRMAELEEENKRLKGMLMAALVRTELALVMPQVLKPVSAEVLSAAGLERGELAEKAEQGVRPKRGHPPFWRRWVGRSKGTS